MSKLYDFVLAIKKQVFLTFKYHFKNIQILDKQVQAILSEKL